MVDGLCICGRECCGNLYSFEWTCIYDAFEVECCAHLYSGGWICFVYLRLGVVQICILADEKDEKVQATSRTQRFPSLYHFVRLPLFLIDLLDNM